MVDRLFVGWTNFKWEMVGWAPITLSTCAAEKTNGNKWQKMLQTFFPMFFDVECSIRTCFDLDWRSVLGTPDTRKPPSPLPASVARDVFFLGLTGPLVGSFLGLFLFNPGWLWWAINPGLTINFLKNKLIKFDQPSIFLVKSWGPLIGKHSHPRLSGWQSNFKD